MTSYYYFIRATDTLALEHSPIFHVKVGKSKRAATAHAAVAAHSLLSDELFYCVRSLESSRFIARLMAQNPSRACYEISVVELEKMLKTAAYVADVKNLSTNFRRNHSYLTAQTRGTNFQNNV
jgi:hypothetical protein